MRGSFVLFAAVLAAGCNDAPECAEPEPADPVMVLVPVVVPFAVEGTPEEPGEPEEPEEPAELAKKPKGKKKRNRCSGRLEIDVGSIVKVGATPLHLPEGGYRVTMTFDNPNNYSVEVGSVTEAVFVDADGHARRAETAPGLGSTWFMGFTIPAHASSKVKVVLPEDGEGAPDVARVTYTRYC